MNPSRPAPHVLRGIQTSPPRLHWRMDGAATEPDAPLVLALHGWGMDEDFFSRLLQGLFPRPFRFLIPRAPFPARPHAAEPEAEEAARTGQRVRGGSWYEYDGNQAAFRRELERVEREFVALVRDVEREQGLAPKRRYLLGFSQGGYCGAWVALRNPDMFSGMAIVGARVKTEFLGAELRRAAERDFRVLLCHGTRDASVKPEAAERSHADLTAAGVRTELRTFDAGHSFGRAQVAA
ncbi:dienelactone hydrolase family protein, partial [bacterium]|nr:dienelactone hydrolase family protein [bacterium]